MEKVHFKSRYILIFSLLLLGVGALAANKWLGNDQVQNEQLIDLSPIETNIDGLSDNEFDTGQMRQYTEFALGEEDDPQARENWFWEQRAYPLDTIPAAVHRAAADAELAAGLKLDHALVEEWKSLGPDPLNDITYGGDSAQDASGRALTVAIDPNNSKTILVGAAQGGIWKSTDDGRTFKPVADNVPSLAVKVIRYAPSNPQIVYAGTGEPHSSTSIYGQGVLKSTDGGENWTHLPSSGNGWDFSELSVSGLQVHPRNPDLIYVTTAYIRTSVPQFNPPSSKPTGIYKSTDGGQSWELLKSGTVYKAWPSYLQGNAGFMDLELSQIDPKTLYASEYFGGVWKSTNGGDNWQRITPMKAGGGADFPASVPNYNFFSPNQARFFLLNRFKLLADLPEFSRIEIGLAQSDPKVLYAGYAVDNFLLDADGNGSFDSNIDINTQVGLLFKTTDGGLNWTWLQDWPRSGTPDYCASQCSYDNMVEVNPKDANDVIIGGSANYNALFPENPADPNSALLNKPWAGMINRTLDGGQSWVDMTPHCAQYGPPDGNNTRPCLAKEAQLVIHPDIHGAAFAPDGRIYVANDGGLYRTGQSDMQMAYLPFVTGGPSSAAALPSSADTGALKAGETIWQNLNANLSTLQFYLFDVHPTDPNKILGGLQDNSVAYWDGRIWEGWGFGDGTLGAFDPKDPKHVYMGTQFSIHRHDNGGAKQALDENGQAANGWKLSIFQAQTGDQNLFNTPFEIDPVTTSTIYAASQGGLYQSNNRGDNWNGRLNPNPLASVPTTISVSPVENKKIWVGTRGGLVYLFDLQASVYGTFGSGLPNRWITKVEASPNDGKVVYVTFSGYDANTPGTPGKVFKSKETNGVKEWVNISGNLPDIPVSGLAVDPNDENRIWVGTDIGVFVTKDGGMTWASYRNNMPVVAIMDLKYNATTGYLSVATHGRGVWRIDPSGPALPPVINGDFEAGQVGWAESSTNGYDIITNDLPDGLTPHSGSWLAWLGGAQNEVSTISQQFTIPNGTPVFLNFYYLIGSADLCVTSDDLLKIQINGIPVVETPMCVDAQVLNWTPVSTDMSLLAGQTITFEFLASVGPNELLSSFYVDDVSFTTAPIAPGFIEQKSGSGNSAGFALERPQP